MAITTQAAEPVAGESIPSPVGRRRLALPPMTAKLATGLILGGVILLFGVIGPFLVQDPAKVDDIGLTGPSGEKWRAAKKHPSG